MKKLSEKIKRSGLLKSKIAEKAGVSPAHLSMMLAGKANMPEDIRNRINDLLDAVIKNCD